MATPTVLQPASFRGDLIRPGDPGYDPARAVFNGMIDRRPQLIGRCRDAADVAALVNLARETGLPLSVYGGGHGVTGAAVVDGGICVDLRGMKGVSVDPSTRIARAEAGLTWGEFDAATQAHGLAVTGGRVSTTGIAGLALGRQGGPTSTSSGTRGRNAWSRRSGPRSTPRLQQIKDRWDPTNLFRHNQNIRPSGWRD